MHLLYQQLYRVAGLQFGLHIFKGKNDSQLSDFHKGSSFRKLKHPRDIIANHRTRFSLDYIT